MLDIRWIRDNQDAFLKGLKDRGFEPAPDRLLKELLDLDEARRTAIQELQDAQARRNAASKDIGKAKQQKDEQAAEKLMAEVASLKATIQDGEEQGARSRQAASRSARRHSEPSRGGRADRR